MADILGGLSNLITGGASKKASGALDNAQGRFDALETPDLEAMKVKLREAVNAGQISPEDAQTYLLESSAQENVTTDPRLRQAQLSALDSLQEVGQGGLTTGDRGDLQRIQGEQASAEKGQRDAILQNAQSRGMAGSGMELASQLMNQQASAGQASQRGFDVAKQAQARALEAMMGAGQMGGNIRTQDFGEQSKLAEARDAISKFNTQNKQAVGLSNTAAHNTAQAANVQNAQDVANRNQDTANNQALYNAGNVKDQFSNNLAKASGAAGVDQARANAATAEGAQKQQLFGTLLGAGASGYNTYANSGDDKKK